MCSIDSPEQGVVELVRHFLRSYIYKHAFSEFFNTQNVSKNVRKTSKSLRPNSQVDIETISCKLCSLLCWLANQCKQFQTLDFALCELLIKTALAVNEQLNYLRTTIVLSSILHCYNCQSKSNDAVINCYLQCTF